MAARKVPEQRPVTRASERAHMNFKYRVRQPLNETKAIVSALDKPRES